jgi:hypothetical protein
VPISYWTAIAQLPAHLVAIALVSALHELGVERTSLLGLALPQGAYLLVSSVQSVAMAFGLVRFGKWAVRSVLRRCP